MEILAAEHLNFAYPGQTINVLDDISFSVQEGAFVTLCGLSGSGKSTLLRHFKNVLKPEGTGSGNVLYFNQSIDELNDRQQAESIGFVSQSAENQIVTDKVWHELAFGLESLGQSTEMIRQRVAEMAMFFGIQDWFYKNVNELSGGQRQILCLASIMTMQPKVLLLDEPTSQLDPIAASEFIHMLQKINSELGITILISEQRLEEVIPISTQIIVMDQGKIIADGTAKEVSELLSRTNHSMVDSLPVPMRVWMKVDHKTLECPITVNHGRSWLMHESAHFQLYNNAAALEQKQIKQTKLKEQTNAFNSKKVTRPTKVTRSISVSVKDIWFRYEKNGKEILKGVNLQAAQGELLCILGGNGTGKSTFLSILAGMKKAQSGSIVLNQKRIGMLPQNPMAFFLKKTVLEDLQEISNDQEKLQYVMQLCELSQFAQRHPYDLSGGEQQRAALAKILLADPDILLLDEPTKGFDNHYKNIFGNVLRKLCQSGKTIILVSHDVEFCAEFADRCALFFDGMIVSENDPVTFFSGNSFYTTAANRMSRGIIDHAITVNDIVNACNNSDPVENESNHSSSDQDMDQDENQSIPIKDNCCVQAAEVRGETQSNKRIKKIKKSNLILAILLIAAIPFTLFAGVYFLDDKKYLFISLLILLESMIPFFVLFEGRNPAARELVMISVLCAICVAGRSLFYMLPEFKPTVALVVLVGAAIGPETGFLVGSVTMLVSNIIFGQGPWTPWQMFALGVTGFIAGILFYRKKEQSQVKRDGKSIILLAMSGFIGAFVFYGGIMNFAAVIMSRAVLSKATLMGYYAAGIPMDLVRGIATFVFILLLAKPFLDKIERVRTKYGLL